MRIVRGPIIVEGKEVFCVDYVELIDVADPCESCTFGENATMLQVLCNRARTNACRGGFLLTREDMVLFELLK